MPEPEVVEKFDFDITFQKKLLALMMQDPQVLIKSFKYLKPHYFDGDILPLMCATLFDYYAKYGKLVTEVVVLNYLREMYDKKEIKLAGKLYPVGLLPAYLNVWRELLKMVVEEKEYIIVKVLEFIKRNMFVETFSRLRTSYLQDTPLDEVIHRAQNDLGEVQRTTFGKNNSHFFFEELNDRLTARIIPIESTKRKILSGIFHMDKLTGGGMVRGELGVLVGDAGSGKSIGLTYIGAFAVRHNLKVLHFTLEGRTGQAPDRYDSRFVGEKYGDVVANKVTRAEYTTQYSVIPGKLVISELISNWDYTIIDIEDHVLNLKLQGFEPDVVIVDYGDLLKPRSKDLANTYLSQQEVYQDLKTLANKHNCVVWTASQVTRPPAGKDPKTDKTFFWTRYTLADCYAKVRIADLMLTLNVTDQEKQENSMRLYLDKYRDSECGFKFGVYTNFSKMTFCIPTQEETMGYSAWLNQQNAESEYIGLLADIEDAKGNNGVKQQTG